MKASGSDTCDRVESPSPADGSISCQNPHRLSSRESGRYDLQMITFQRFRNATFIARLSKNPSL
jgi:hypothetical protein